MKEVGNATVAQPRGFLAQAVGAAPFAGGLPTRPAQRRHVRIDQAPGDLALAKARMQGIKNAHEHDQARTLER